jgi:hypothetical protein
MTAPVPIPFWTQSYEARSKTTTAERLENWYLEVNAQNAKYPYTLYPTPGLLRLATIGTGPIRGIHRMVNDLYVVSGNELYRVPHTLNAVLVGEIKGWGNVFMTTNETHVLIVTGQSWSYAADTDNIFQIAETDMVGALYQDGYGILGKRGTEQFYISDLDDLTSWTATEFSSADALADPLVGILSLQRRLMILGRDSTEWWSNIGAADFPFARDSGGFAEIGCKAPGSVVKAGNAGYWLGHDGGLGGYQVYRSQGYQPAPITKAGISKVIEELTDPDDAWGFAYTQEQHTFYVLSFSKKTIVFDLSTGLWHYRKSENIDRWRASGHAYIWGKNVVGDFENGKIYELDLDTFDDDGATIRRSADSAPIHARGDMATMHEFFIDMDTGRGLDGSDQGSDPELMISWSDDGGRTWGNEITMKAGKIGEYRTQVRMWGLGQFRQRIMRVAVSDPIPVYLHGAWANIEANPV